ncbi:MAG: K(+)-transporting ATPase subunit C [Chthoniobacteraceae bacterium]
MKTILSEILRSVVATIVFAIVLCGLYPLVVYGVGQAFFRHQANGSLILSKDGKVLGSEWLGQQFTSDKYFNSRPSAAGTGYDASSSGGTNLGPTSQKLNDSIKAAVDAYRKQNNLAADAPVPADAVTSSASGLDPHISPANALIQLPRVAKARNLDPAKVQELVEQNTDRPSLGILGDPGVNVLKLNLALDALGSK